MLFVSGGILYLTFQDIAPQAKLENAWGPPLGAVMGFMVALAASLTVGG
jgi:zinc transporter, ZIP family